MNAKTLGLITLVLAMIVAALAGPVSASAQSPQDLEMRAWAMNDFSQLMVAVEQDAGSSRFAAQVYDEFTPAMIEDTFDIEIDETYHATRADLREANVTQMTVYNGFVTTDDTFGVVIVAQDGRYDAGQLRRGLQPGRVVSGLAQLGQAGAWAVGAGRVGCDGR